MDKTSSSNKRPAPPETERALILILVTSLLRHYDESLEGKPHTVPDFEAVVPHFWIAMARAAAVLAGQESEKNPEAGQDMPELVRRWVHNGVLQSYVADTLHPAGQILMKIGHLGIGVTEEEVVTGNDDERFFEEASVLLADAARISPGRHDILADLCQALAVRATLGGAGSTAHLREALKRGDQAVASFPEADRYIVKTGKLHPTYGALLSTAGILRWMTAAKTKDAKKKRPLLEEACRLMRLVMKKGDIDKPELRMAYDRAAEELAQLPAFFVASAWSGRLRLGRNPYPWLGAPRRRSFKHRSATSAVSFSRRAAPQKSFTEHRGRSTGGAPPRLADRAEGCKPM